MKKTNSTININNFSNSTSLQLTQTTVVDREEALALDTWLDKLNKGVGWVWDGTKAVCRWCFEHRTPLTISAIVIGSA
jgi:hypothetical protein